MLLNRVAVRGSFTLLVLLKILMKILLPWESIAS